MKAPSVKILFKVLLLSTNTSTLYSRLLPASTFTSSSPSSHLPALPDHTFAPLSLCSHSLFFLHSLSIHMQDLKTETKADQDYPKAMRSVSDFIFLAQGAGNLDTNFCPGGYLNILNHQRITNHAIATKLPRAAMMHIKLPLRSTTMSGSKIMQAWALRKIGKKSPMEAYAHRVLLLTINY